MKKVNVKLGSMNAVKDFNAIVSKYACDIDLVSGRYVVDAKSIMGIYSLDLSSPIEVQIHCDDCDDLVAELKPYIVD